MHEIVHLGTVRGTPMQALFGATLGFFIGFAAVSLFGPTAQLLKQVMGLTPLQVGLLVAIPAATGSLLRIPFGAWVDTTGGRKPFVILLALSAVGMVGLLGVLTAYYPDHLTSAHYPLLLFLGLLVGCGIATFSVGIGQVSYWHPHDLQGRALAIYAGFGNIAPGIFALLIPLLIAALGLTWTYAVWLGLLLAGVAGYAYVSCDAPYFQIRRRERTMTVQEAAQRAQLQGQDLFPAGGAWEGLVATIHLGRIWALIFLYFTSFGGFLALTAWFPSFWMGRFDVTLTLAGTLTMLYSVLASIIRVPGGFLSDRIGGEQVAIVAFFVMLAGTLLLAASMTVTTAVLAMVVMAIGMGVANAAIFKLVPYYLAAYGSGAGAGWVGGLGAFGGLVLPPVFGLLVQVSGREQGYLMGALILAALAAGCIIVTAALWKTRVAVAASSAVRGPFLFTCPRDKIVAEVWVAAASGEMPYGRMVRCSLHGEGETCDAACLNQLADAETSSAEGAH